MEKSKWCDIWLVGLALVVWHIWKKRNRIIFKEVDLSTEQLISKIKIAIEEVVNGKSVMRNKYRYNNWDRSMEIKWSLKERGPVVPSKKQVDKNLIKWNAPPKDWVKLNFDGASKGNPGRASFGVVLRDENNELISGVYGNLGECSNNEAKIRALEAGLNMCVEGDISKVIIEGDSQVIINGVIQYVFHN